LKAFVRSRIVILELFTLGFGLYLLQKSDANLQTTSSILLFCIFAFVLPTGKGFPHFCPGERRCLFLLWRFFPIQGATIVEQQRDSHLAELRASDPTAYLTELSEIGEDRWFRESHEFDRPAPNFQATEHDLDPVVSVASAHHVLKLDLKPWVRRSLPNVPSNGSWLHLNLHRV
jgi:hypothetical protein